MSWFQSSRRGLEGISSQEVLEVGDGRIGVGESGECRRNCER